MKKNNNWEMPDGAAIHRPHAGYWQLGMHVEHEYHKCLDNPVLLNIMFTNYNTKLMYIF